MNKLKAALLSLLMTTAYAAGVPEKHPTDSFSIGKPSSSSDKVLTFDFGGVNNSSISGTSLGVFQYNKNTFTVGDGLSSSKTFIANTGAGASNPKIKFDPSASEWQFANDGVNFDSFGSGSGGSSGVNLLKNPGFESGVAQGWSNTGGTFAAVTSGSNLLIGKGSATFLAGAGGQFVTSTLYTVPFGLQGQGCSASVMYKGGSANLTFQVVDNSSNVLVSQVLSASTVPQTINSAFICPSSGSIQVKLLSTGASAIVALDQMFLGSNALLAISQANFVGSVKWPNAAACIWTRTSADTYGSFPANSNCTFPSGGNIEGTASAPSTKIPAIHFSSLAPGDYEIHATAQFAMQTATNVCQWGISDGTTTKVAGGAGSSSGNSTVNTVVARFHYDNSQSNVTFEVQGTGDQASVACDIFDNAGVQELNIWVKVLPTVQQQAFNPSQVSNSWSGAHASDCQFLTTSTTYADPAFDASCTFSEYTNVNFGTVTSYNNGTPGNNLPGIVFTPSRVGTYFVCANAMAANNTLAAFTDLELSDLVPTVIARGSMSSSSSSNPQFTSVPVCGSYKATSTSPVTVRLRMKSSSGAATAEIDGNGTQSDAISWSIFQIDQSLPTPVLMGSVVSPSSGVENSARASIDKAGGNCTSDPCDIESQSGTWLTSVNRTGTGTYNINISAGTFSNKPSCVCSSTSSGYAVIPCMAAASSSTLVTITTYDFAAALRDSFFNVICMGPK